MMIIIIMVLIPSHTTNASNDIIRVNPLNAPPSANEI
jgi:hypothetical protein